MKRQILILGTILTIVSATKAQDILQSQVPSVIVNELNKEFPKATDIEWEMKGDLYNAEFEISGNIDHDVWYNSEGKMVKHKEDISKSELPKAINNVLKTEYNSYSIDDLERITENGKVIYKMELESLTKTDWDIVFDSNGKVLSKKVD